MNRPQMKFQFELALNESGIDSFENDEIASWLSQAERSLLNQTYYNQSLKRREQSVPPNSFQESQFSIDILRPFEIRVSTFEAQITNLDQGSKLIFIGGNHTDLISRFKGSVMRVEDSDIAPTNDGRYTIVDLDFDGSDTRILVAENIPNSVVSGNITIFKTLPSGDAFGAFAPLPTDLAHTTSLGAISEKQLIPVRYLRDNDVTEHLNNSFTFPVYDDVNKKYRLWYSVRTDKGIEGIAMYPGTIENNDDNSSSYNLVLDYIRHTTPIVEADLTDITKFSEFPEFTHDWIVKEAVSLYLYSVSDPSFKSEQEKIVSGRI